MGKLMGKPLSIFKRTTGLNKKQTDAYLDYNIESGITELSEAVNIDINDKGKIKRRAGYVSIDSGDWHSIKGFGDFGLGVSGDSLYIIHGDGVTTGIRSGLTEDRKMEYAQVKDRIFYCNGHENGVVIGSVSWTWVSTTLPTTPGVKYDMRYFSSAPVGEFVSYLSGRVYVARGNTLFYSLPWAWYWFNLGADFIPFDSSINMLCPTSEGMFVGTDNGLVFLRGLNPSEAELRKIDNSIAVKYTNVEINPRKFVDGTSLSGKTWMWLSDKGICVGSGEGVVHNLTQERLDIEFALSGAGMFDGSKYIGLLNP